MKGIRYKFVTGEVVYVRVEDEKIKEIHKECQRLAYNSNKTQRRHRAKINVSQMAKLKGYASEVEYFDSLFVEEETVETIVFRNETQREQNMLLRKALKVLTEIERRRFLRSAFGKTYSEIARLENVSSINSICKSVKTAKRKLREEIERITQDDDFYRKVFLRWKNKSKKMK